MEYQHTSVLYEASLAGLNIKPDGIYVDGTLGGGGHAAGICAALSACGTFVGIDRDEDALSAAGLRLAKYDCRKQFVQSNYCDLDEVLRGLGIDGVDGILLDLGVSSFQLDNKDRGFSYMQDAPLDMRMNRDDPLTAEEVVNTYNEKALTRIIREYGEERWASRISSFIVNGRKEQPIRTTGELVELIKAAIPAAARREGPHPAKRTFQGIRIEVNEELDGLEQAMNTGINSLNHGGRFCVITFHSLEDRIVKEAFARFENPCTCPKDFPVCTCGKTPLGARVTRKPIVAGDDELRENPRSRSAKLRIFEKNIHDKVRSAKTQ